jgi:hypothetical protein
LKRWESPLLLLALRAQVHERRRWQMLEAALPQLNQTLLELLARHRLVMNSEFVKPSGSGPVCAPIFCALRSWPVGTHRRSTTPACTI